MLRLVDLRKGFAGRPALDGLSLAVRRGEVYGLLGPNGAGKTTTISLIVGLLSPDSGTITIDSRGAPTDPEVRRRIGLAPQSVALYDDLTASENLRVFARVYGLDARRARARTGELLDFAGLRDRADARVRTFSGGMKRRLNLALAMVHDPPLLLLDEPTVGVDPHSRNAILESILALRAQGKTVVYTTHYMEEAQRVCDRVGVIDRGRLLAEGTVHELLAAHAGASVITIERAGVVERVHAERPLEQLQQILASGSVTGVHIERASLETVFLSLTGRSLRD